MQRSVIQLPSHGLQGPKRIAELDGVRGIAILLVLIWHYPGGVLMPEPGSWGALIKEAVAFCAHGVDLFFVLSGVLIGNILFEQRQATNYFATFYARRFMRLMPLYVVVVGCYCVFAQFADRSSDVANWLIAGSWSNTESAVPSWSYFAYLQNFYMSSEQAWGGQWLAPTWSLAVEEQFYLAAPLLIWLLPMRSVPMVVGALVIAAPLFRIIATAETGWLWPSHVMLPSRFDALFLGILAAYYLRRPEVEHWLRANQALLLRLLAISSLGVVAMTLAGIKIGTSAMASLGYTYVALTSLVFILAALYVERPWLKTVLTNPWLTWIGLVSYGIYLLHMPMLGLTAMLMGDAFSVSVLIMATIATFAVAAVSWYGFEKPLLRFGRRFRYRTSSEAPRGIGVPAQAG